MVTLGYCKNGEVQLGYEHLMGEGNGYPEQNCCACGKPRPEESDVPHCFVPKNLDKHNVPMCLPKETEHEYSVGLHFGGTVCTVKRDTMESTCIQYRTGAGVLRHDDTSAVPNSDKAMFYNSAFEIRAAVFERHTRF